MAGPFEVDPNAVERLGPAFPFFVNDLLSAEVGRAGLKGYQLDINVRTTTPDGGVDAALWSGVATNWLPAGNSAWQFKSSDLSPQECRDELRNATWARELVAAGATYVLVLGRPLVADTKKSRLDALIAEAKDLKLDVDAMRVYDGHQLARWATEFPARALDRRLGGPGPVLLEFDRWSTSPDHRERWVTCASRADMEEAVNAVARGDLAYYRLEGGSGLGKTRLAMEVIRSSAASALVVYAPRGEQLSPESISYLAQIDRTSILVVDNCSRSHHQSILEQVGSADVRVITIGSDSEERLVRTPLHQLPPALTEEIDAILLENVTGIWPEAARVVRENCFGNVRTALLLATRLVAEGEQNVTELLRENDFKHLIMTLLPEHADFFSAAVLALLERVGFDEDRAHQLEVLAAFANVPPDQLKNTANQLEAAGLLSRHGRYRSVVPQPVAVFLAASAWESLGDSIITDLARSADREMLAALFHRSAELGRFEPVRTVLIRLLAPDGPYGSLRTIEESGLADFLVELAIVLPEETAVHLAELIEATPLDDLRSYVASRRAMVRSLEKLVWHQETFELAATALLRLALAENESWANNATGQWKALFGARLPITAAAPGDRLKYLRKCALAAPPEVRRLAAEAAADALHPYESAMLSGELQEGSIVAPRGTVRPGEEALQYWETLARTLAELTTDVDEMTADTAARGLVRALHPFAAVPQVGEALATAVRTFSGEALRMARRELGRLVDDVEAFGEDETDSALRQVLASLPLQSDLERLRDLADRDPWEWRDESRQTELATLVARLAAEGHIDDVIAWLAQDELGSSWQLGRALASVDESQNFLSAIAAAAHVNAPALAGYFQHFAEVGEVSALDDFLDSELGVALPPTIRLSLTATGGRTDRARIRVVELARQIDVSDAASRTMYWQEDLSVQEDGELLEDWKARISTDRDYAAVVDWVQMLAYRKGGLPSELKEVTRDLLVMRIDHPNLGNQRWDWCELANALASDFPLDITVVILELIAGGMTMLDSDGEAATLRSTAATAPVAVWDLIAERLVQGDWRLSMTARGWLTSALPLQVVTDWIADSIDRARIVASIAPAGGDSPDGLAVWLLDHFPSDEEIAGSLAGEFHSGGWVGPWSGRLEMQIGQLEGWRRDTSLPLPVRQWARKMIDSLAAERTQALQREAEERR